MSDLTPEELLYECHQNCMAVISSALEKCPEKNRASFALTIGPSISSGIGVSMDRLCGGGFDVLAELHRLLDENFEYCSEHGEEMRIS